MSLAKLRGAAAPQAPSDRGASAAEYAGLLVLAALVFAALFILIGPRVSDDVRTALCTILRIEPCQGASGPSQAQPPWQPKPDNSQARCVTDQRLSYAEVTGYVQPRIVGGRGNLRWTTYIRTLSNGPGKPPTYEVTLQDWKEASVQAGVEKEGTVPFDALAYLGLNSTEGKVFTFNSKADADAFEKQIPRYFIGGTAYDAVQDATGPVGWVLGAVNHLTGNRIKNWAQGDPPKPQQEYHEAGPTAGVELGADLPLGGGNKVSLSARGRFYRLYGINTNNATGAKTYYLRDNNRIQPSAAISLPSLSSALSGLGAKVAGKDVQSAIAKSVLAKTGASVGVPEKIAQYVIKNGSAGLSLKWRYNTQYQVKVDKNGKMTGVSKVTDTIATWYVQGNLKGPTRGARDDKAQGLVSISSSRTTETDTFNIKTPQDRETAVNGIRDVLAQNIVNPITPPKDDGLEQAFSNRGIKTRLNFDNSVRNGKLTGRNYGAKGLIGVELHDEHEQGHLANAEYWDPSSASWKDWTNCR